MKPREINLEHFRDPIDWKTREIMNRNIELNGEEANSDNENDKIMKSEHDSDSELAVSDSDIEK